MASIRNNPGTASLRDLGRDAAAKPPEIVTYDAAAVEDDEESALARVRAGRYDPARGGECDGADLQAYSVTSQGGLECHRPAALRVRQIEPAHATGCSA